MLKDTKISKQWILTQISQTTHLLDTYNPEQEYFQKLKEFIYNKVIKEVYGSPNAIAKFFLSGQSIEAYTFLGYEKIQGRTPELPALTLANYNSLMTYLLSEAGKELEKHKPNDSEPTT